MVSRIIYGLIIGLPVGTTFCDLVASIARVEGASMQPTLNPNPYQQDYILLNKIGKYNVSRGDIVTIISPRNPGTRLVKRVVGIEGDTIVTMGYKQSVVKVPQGHIWVEGDHTEQSADSNSFGPVSIGLVDAKVPWIIWPLHRIQPLKKKAIERRKLNYIV